MNTALLSSRHRNGFSLLELLTVIAIVGILVGLVMMAPALLRTSSLATAGNSVVEDLAYARELATTGNQPTEIWFLQPGAGGAFTGVQIYTVDQAGKSVAYGAVHHLPPSIGMDSGALSPLLNAGTQQQWTSSQPQVPIPGYGLNYNVWFIRFKPDGSTTLATTRNWWITLHDIALGDGLVSLPPNYAIVGMDPVTGAVSLYRP